MACSGTNLKALVFDTKSLPWVPNHNRFETCTNSRDVLISRELTLDPISTFQVAPCHANVTFVSGAAQGGNGWGDSQACLDC